jgi:hypothetical protein
MDEGDYNIALYASRGFETRTASCCAKFGSSLIVRSTANVIDYPLQTFDAVSFSGGTVNAVYNPKIMALKTEPFGCNKFVEANGARSIEIKPFDEYTHKFNLCIGEEKAELTYLDKIIKYYSAVKVLLALCVRQNNVGFDVAIHKKQEDGKFYKSGICKIYDGYSKILFLYDIHKDSITQIGKGWNLPEINDTNLGDFISLRNSKTHGGVANWNNNADIYTPSLALVYACALKRIGFTDENVGNALLQIF